MLSKNKVVEAVSDGQAFPSLFIEHEGRHFPILSRRMSGVLFDAWGGLLKRHQDALQRADNSIELEVAGGFYRFVRERFSKDEALFFVSVCDGDQKSHEIVFPAAIKSKDKLILFYILSPATDGECFPEIWLRCLRSSRRRFAFFRFFLFDWIVILKESVLSSVRAH